uniref:Uncharacterized protein n=1 Tax=Steinernema glaseri TaxID=37863 RepID=A0A1I7YUW1_9BILA
MFAFTMSKRINISLDNISERTLFNHIAKQKNKLVERRKQAAKSQETSNFSIARRSIVRPVDKTNLVLVRK